MAVTKVQESSGFVTASTSYTATIPNNPATGHLLTLAVMIDKNPAGTFTTPTGWTVLASYRGTSVSSAIYYRIATGAAQDKTATFTSSPTASRDFAYALTEWSFSPTGTPTVATVPSPADDVNVATLTANPGNATAVGVALAFAGMDTVNANWAPTWSNGYTGITVKGDGTGNAGLAIAYKELTSGATSNTTITYNDTDQATLTVARFATAVPDTTNPATVTGVTVTGINETFADVAWNASSDNVGVTGYNIYLGGVLKTSVGAVTSTTLTGLTAGTTYSLTVRAFDAAGNLSTASSAVTFTTLTADTTPPAQVTGVNVTSIGQTTATVLWNATTDNRGVVGYLIYLNGTLKTSVGSGTSANLTGLTQNTAYTVTVRAQDAAGNLSTVSAGLNFTTDGPKPPRTRHGLSATIPDMVELTPAVVRPEIVAYEQKFETNTTDSWVSTGDTVAWNSGPGQDGTSGHLTVTMASTGTSPNQYTSLLTRTITGLIVGQDYGISASVDLNGMGTSSLGVRAGVTGMAAPTWVPPNLLTAGTYRRIAFYGFTATATSHQIFLETQGNVNLVRWDWIKVFDAPEITSPAVYGPLELDVLDGEVTLDFERSPYAEAVLTCSLPEATTTLDRIDTRKVIWSTITSTRITLPAGTTQTDTYQLHLREREIDYAEGTMTLRLASDDALLLDGGNKITSTVDTGPKSRASSLKSVAAYVIGQLNAFTGTITINGTADYNLTTTNTDSDALEWPPGVSAWDFLNPLVEAAGLRLFCDENRAWWLVDPETYSVAGSVDPLVPGVNQLSFREVTSRNDDGWVDAVSVEYHWTDSAGVEQTTVRSTYQQGFTKMAAFERNTKPDTASTVATAIWNRAQRRYRTYYVDGLSDYAALPGKTVSVTRPMAGATTESKQISSVTWRWDSEGDGHGTMTLGLRPVP